MSSYIVAKDLATVSQECKRSRRETSKQRARGKLREYLPWSISERLQSNCCSEMAIENKSRFVIVCI